MKNSELVFLTILILSVIVMVAIVIYHFISKKKMIHSKVVNFFPVWSHDNYCSNVSHRKVGIILKESFMSCIE